MRIVRTPAICLVGGVLAVVASLFLSSASHAAPATQQAQLQNLSLELRQQLESQRTPLYYRLLQSDNPAQQRLNANPDIKLMFIRESGIPAYYTLRNLNAAKTISTDRTWPGGSGGFSLSGSGTTLGKLGIWDGGGVLTNHRELTGRVTQMDSPGGTIAHATHVSGTMIAQGVSGSAKGMSFQGTLAAYDWDYDTSEMASAAASGMNVSNHSYGFVTGWYNDGFDWYWYGDITVSTFEDYGFGFYSAEAQQLDEIASDAPHYMICRSAGNDRDDAGPGPGGGHYYWDGSDWAWGTDTRDPDGGDDGYDTISWNDTAKNILTVGAVSDITSGYISPEDVVITSFSCFGPTDDGRIKPDIVANGTSLYSCSNSGTSSYMSMSGTSMSSPNASGSLNLLVRHYEATHGGTTPLSSTMKAVLIQTADEAGNYTGPDYMFGWGLMNTVKAAQLIKADSSSPERIIEQSLANGDTDQYYITSDGLSAIRISLAWIDPAGTPPAPSLNPTTPMLVNDLDLRLIRVATSTVYQPYVLNPASPASAPTTGDNWRDNCEQVYLASPAAGQYRITVTHKGTLASPQTYSLVASLQMGAGDSQPPVVTVTAPNGGEIWDIGSTYDITWTATDNIGVTSISILLSRDGGIAYPETLATGEANDGVYPWFVEGESSLTARIKVIAYDAASNSASDASDGDFVIYDPLSGVNSVEIPAALVVSGSTPNPLRDRATIRFGLPEAGRVEIDVFDVSGRKVATVADRDYLAGYHDVEWRPAAGECGSGVYLLRVRFGREEVTSKVIISR